MHHNLQPLFLTVDLVSAATLVAWWAGIAPAVATTLTVCWVSYCFIKEIYAWFNRPRKKK